ncbi:hypothetical protein CRG98_001788 [Punica granatum]|uniref:Uncharacterized protein n=1 Tax=Punica granatum TaxID=22663 RepID=A0A2I0LAV7_PUNGR|nr:hypothetical protein CRG98_001788 [Punica granatum]
MGGLGRRMLGRGEKLELHDNGSEVFSEGPLELVGHQHNPSNVEAYQQLQVWNLIAL